MRSLAAALTAAAALAPRAPTNAQSIARRVDAVREGTIVMRFAAKPGVCGDGTGSTWTRSLDSWNGARMCVHGPVRVALGRADAATVSVRVFVGDAWRAGADEHDLGFVSAAAAAHYLVETAHHLGGRSGDAAVSAAFFADSVDIAADLAALVRDESAPLDARRQALYWAGETSMPTRDLARLYDGLGSFALREHFTFVISQRRDDPAIDKLIDIAQHDADHEVRKRAMYWLGQTEHPRALKFLRDVITR